MFDDLAISRSLAQGYQDRHPDDEQFSPTVFQPSNWPTYAPTPLTLPTELQSSLDRFAEFYPTVHPKRQLTWIHSLGTVTFTARFPKGEKTLTVSLFQALVLMLFNDGVDKLKFREIREHVDLGKWRPPQWLVNSNLH